MSGCEVGELQAVFAVHVDSNRPVEDVAASVAMDSFTLQVDNEQYIAFRRNLLAVEACHTPGRVEELEVMFAQRHDGLAGSVDDVEERRVVDTFDSECFHCLEGCGDRHFIGCVGTHAHCRRILADAFHGALSIAMAPLMKLQPL